MNLHSESTEVAAKVERPRLVFFGVKYGKDVPAFVRKLREDHLRCLEQWFEIVSIGEDCDYQRICDRHEPALSLFESGVNQTGCERLRVSNIRGYDHVPRV